MNTVWEDIKAILARPIVTLIVLIFLSLAICGLYANETEQGPLHLMQKASDVVTSPISELSVRSNNSLSTVFDYINNELADEDSLKDLQNENAKLKTQLVMAEKYKQEAERLQKLLNIKDQYKSEGVATHVSGKSSSAWNQYIIASAGFNDGVCAGQTVLGINGVVGQVTTVGPDSCNIRLLSDPNSGVAVKIMSTNDDCILRGSLDGVLYLEGLDANANVQAGDVVVTSGLGGSYVSDLVIGSVSQITNSHTGSNRKVIVKPIESSDNISEVFIVKESK